MGKTISAFSEFTGRVTAEITTVTCGADVGGSLAGTSFQFSGKDKGGTERTFQPYFVVAGVGEDPTLGTQETDAITFRADVAGDHESTYFTLHDGSAAGVESDRYVYFTVAGAGYDPGVGEQEESTVQAVDDVAGALDGCYYTFEDGAAQGYFMWFSVHGLANVNPQLGLPEISSIITVADVAGSLNSTYFQFEDGAANAFYVWYNVGGAGVDPAPGGTGLAVAILANATAHEVAVATAAVLDARAEFIAPAPALDTIILTNAASGVAADIADGAAATGFTFNVEQDGIDPVAALAGFLGIEVPIWVGITAEEIVQRMIATVDLSWYETFAVAVVPGAPDTMHMINVTPGAATDIADGAGALATTFTLTMVIDGVDALPALAGFTPLAAVDIAAGDPDEAVAMAFVNAVNGVEGWTAVQRAAPNDEIVDLLHPTRGDCTDTADGNIGGVFAVATTDGLDPTPAIHGIAVPIALNALAATVAQALRGAIQAAVLADALVDSGGVDPDVVITNRWAGTVTDAADVDTGFVIVTTQQGVAAIVTNMNVNVAAAVYVVKPRPFETIFVREIEVQLSDTDVTGGAEFGDLGAALANGLYWEVVDRAGVQIRQITPLIKDNAGLAAMGSSSMLLGTTTMIVHLDCVAAYGAQIGVDGRRGEYLQCRQQDNPNGITTFYSEIRGSRETYE